MAQQQWYNKADLIEEARRRHFRANEELIDDWIAKGLLGEAGYRKRPGHGSIARWSEAQLQLFLTLLEHRQREQGKVRIGILCNVPVWKWLYWGELGGVALPQVRQAMRTWVTFRKDIPAKKFGKTRRN